MRSTRFALFLSFAFLFYVAAQGAKVTFTNNCQYTVWPATLTGGQNPQLSTTGFELGSGASNSMDLPSPWSGRFWARTGCSSDNNGGFGCATGDCASGKVECNGAGGNPPATLVEITTVADGGKDFYDVSNVDGFNVPVSVTPQGGSGGDCKASSCPRNINEACPSELQQRQGSNGGGVIACKSACLAFKEDQYCCTGPNNTPETCPPTNYSQIFEDQCPDAYSYAYDDKNSTFTCFNPDYVITFCP